MKVTVLLLFTLFFPAASFAAIPEFYIPPVGVKYTDASTVYSLMTVQYEGLEHASCARDKMFDGRDLGLRAVAGMTITSLEFKLGNELVDGRPRGYIYASIHFSDGSKESTFGCKLK